MNKISQLATSFAKLLLLLFCLSAWMPVMATTITLDGNASDWTEQDRLDTPPGTPVTGYKLYGRYEGNTYNLLLQSTSRTIGAATTIWLNTDQNASTGYQIFGNTGGEEFNVNFYTDGKPYLYSGADGQNYIGGPLNYVVKASGTGSIMEIAIPENLIGTPSGSGINLFLDVNNADFLPAAYGATNQYVLSKQALPAGGSVTERRIAIVYSQTSAARFWDLKNYAQLFMSAQTQAMMAGIPFDLLNESDLTDLSKLVKYDTLVFPYFAYVPDATAATIEQNLGLAAFKYNVGIVAAGDFMTNKADGSSMAGDAYSRMKSLFGLTRVDGVGPTNITVKAANVTHPMMKGEYTNGESLLSYTDAYTSYFGASGAYTVTPVATQTVNNATQNAVVASVTGGRNVHFGTVGFFADGNLLWSALRWSVYGDAPLAGMQLGRQKAVFVSRNDMDQSMFVDEVPTVDAPLYTKYLQPWKTKYGFVGTFYINVGNNQAAGEYTNWAVSTPLYKNYMSIGNEIGTHSYTHPADTNVLSSAQVKFEFADSRSIIEQNLGLTNIGAAVPGAPETLKTSQDIIQHVNYLTGGYAGVGAGFPNAIGYLTPSDTKVYMSPNMSFDFTLIEFKKMTAAQAQAQWFTEFDGLTKHAKQAVVHWPWHDYGPFDPDKAGYTPAMFENLIKKAYSFGSEFITGDELRKRIENFRKTILESTLVDASTVNVKLTSADAGRAAIDVSQASSGKKIKSIDNWYAYNDTQVFSDKDGGTFNVRLGTAADALTHITQLPMRANLVSLTGTGMDLNFTVEGEGQMVLRTRCLLRPNVTGGATITSFSGQTLTLTLPTLRSYTINVDCIL
ncbi:MAG: hypothetical protein RI964_1384 [Pseudomonadota bacterium]|jgi:hypothetical protein